MPEDKSPETLIELGFKLVDGIARRFISYRPLASEIRASFRSTSEELIDWPQVREVAISTLALQRELPIPPTPEFVEQYPVMLKSAQREVAEYTGLPVSGIPDTIEVFTQTEWIDANIKNFQLIFEPIGQKYTEAIRRMEKPRSRRARKIAQALLTIQVGVLIGYLGRNVLGQYDISLPKPEEAGKLYVVEANVNRAEQKLRLVPRDFRYWITLHEVTHTFEFHCNTWLRPYLTETMRSYLKTLEWSGRRSQSPLKNIKISELRKRDEALKAGSLISLISTPEQQRILLKLQAAMCLLEGYSTHVMDAVGKELLPSYDTMKHRFEKRKQMRSGSEKMLQRMLGLELKLQQYKLGENFVSTVVNERGMGFMNWVWERPENLPTIEEIQDPASWISRMEKTSV